MNEGLVHQNHQTKWGIVQAIFDGGYWWQLGDGTAGWVYDHDGLRPTIFSGNSQGYFSKCPNCWCIGNFHRKMMINQKFQDQKLPVKMKICQQPFCGDRMYHQQYDLCSKIGALPAARCTFFSVYQISGGVSTRNWVKSCTKSREPPLGKSSKEHIPEKSTGSYRFQDHRIFDLGLCGRLSLWTWIKMWSKFQAWLHSHPRWHRSPMRPKKWRNHFQ